ncbi:pyridoxal phosphate-dependent transferase [Zopfochytrium polystomum]|nr:pyridoxal phosphate-dependent transferase [Zopfochytrium polystomum]
MCADVAARRVNGIAMHLTAANTRSRSSNFGGVPLIPLDPIFALSAAHTADPDPNKINLGIGAYRDNSGKPWVLPVVKKAKDILHNDQTLNHEYLPIDGLRTYTDAAAKLILGSDSPVIAAKRFAAVQTISGTGAVRVGAEFLAKFRKSPVYVSSPTWGNHNQIFGDAGFEVRSYPYWDAKNRSLAFDALIKTMQDSPDGSIFVLHACAHNPTGVDPTKAQWAKIADIMTSKSLFPFFDCAYQGFASGSLEADAWAVRYFVHERGFEVFVAQSFSKNFGLYSERAGCLTVVTENEDVAVRVRSQLCRLIRASFSNPPAFGARIVNLVLNNPQLYAEWEDNLRTMANRIIAMRRSVVAHLKELKTPGDWTHITSQIGMFSFTGLTVAQVKEIKARFHVYMTDNGRVSMAGLNEGNVKRFAAAIDYVVRNVQ